MAILKGSFVSDYEEGFIRTEGTLDTKTGEISVKDTQVDNLAAILDYGPLKRKYFEDKDGTKYKIPQ